MFLKLDTIFFIIFAIIGVLSIFWLFKIETRLKRFFLGKKGKDLEDTIEILEDKIKSLDKEIINAKKEISILHSKAKKSLQGFETIRFNPFPDQGSNQSFAIGFINEQEDGIVISSLYSRDRMSVFAKPIKSGKSAYELTNEEQEAINNARNYIGQ